MQGGRLSSLIISTSGIPRARAHARVSLLIQFKANAEISRTPTGSQKSYFLISVLFRIYDFPSPVGSPPGWASRATDFPGLHGAPKIVFPCIGSNSNLLFLVAGTSPSMIAPHGPCYNQLKQGARHCIKLETFMFSMLCTKLKVLHLLSLNTGRRCPQDRSRALYSELEQRARHCIRLEPLIFSVLCTRLQVLHLLKLNTGRRCPQDRGRALYSQLKQRALVHKTRTSHVQYAVY